MVRFFCLNSFSSSNEKCFRQSCWKKSKHVLYSITLFFWNRSVCDIMWKNTVEPGRPQMTIWLMCIACWTSKATDTHSEYVTLTVFLLQVWLYERASVLRYTFVDCAFRDIGAWPLLSSCVVYCVGGNTVTGRSPFRALLSHILRWLLVSVFFRYCSLSYCLYV